MSSVGEFEAALSALPASGRPPVISSAPPIERAAVLGAGAVGQALSCAVLAAGCEVRLHSAFESELEGLAAADSITVRGEDLVGTYRLSPGAGHEPHVMVRQAIDAAVIGAEAVLVATPAVVHPIYAGLMAPVLEDGQLVALVPGRGFGAVEFARCLRRFGCSADVTIVEACSAPYLASVPEPGALRVHAVKRTLLAAALPNARTTAAIEALRRLLPMLRDATGVLETTFSDPSALINLPPAILGSAAVSDQAPSLRDRLPGQLTKTVVRRLDAERVRIAFAFGVRGLRPVQDWLADTYDLDGEDLDDVLDRMAAYDAMPAGGPPSLDQRTHDLVATSLVPLASAAELAGIPAPATRALVDLASVLGGVDYMRHGRTLASLGLDRMSADSIRRALDGSDPSLLAEALA